MDVVEKSILERRLDEMRKPFKLFLRAQTFASALLLVGLAAALGMVNNGWQDAYAAIQALPILLRFGPFRLEGNLLGWVNDGLIAVFFFLIGLEIKRELIAGELRNRGRRNLLLAAAMGGMAVPAGLYAAINALGTGGAPHGWGVPMATDTALAIGVLALLGKRIPSSLTAVLVGLAIVDDIGAMLIIAVFYTEQLEWSGLALAGVTLIVLLAGNRAGVRAAAFYLTGTLVLWLAIHHGGIHASFAGVVGAFTVPARPRKTTGWLARRLGTISQRIGQRRGSSDVLANASEHVDIRNLEIAARRATTPLRRWEESLELPVALIILPAFAFLNGGILIDVQALQQVVAQPVPLGIIAGLLVGKPLGISVGAMLAVRLGAADLPADLSWRHLLGLGMVAGIGFTMSTFIGNLAFGSSGADIDLAKLAILLASCIAGVLGVAILLRTSTHP